MKIKIKDTLFYFTIKILARDNTLNIRKRGNY